MEHLKSPTRNDELDINKSMINETIIPSVMDEMDDSATNKTKYSSDINKMDTSENIKTKYLQSPQEVFDEQDPERSTITLIIVSNISSIQKQKKDNLEK